MLEEFAQIVEKIHANTEKHVTSFNKRYSRGLTHTCRGLVDSAKHLISKKLSYDELFTSDSLENNLGNFGKDLVALISSQCSKFQRRPELQRQKFC